MNAALKDIWNHEQAANDNEPPPIDNEFAEMAAGRINAVWNGNHFKGDHLTAACCAGIEYGLLVSARLIRRVRAEQLIDVNCQMRKLSESHHKMVRLSYAQATVQTVDRAALMARYQPHAESKDRFRATWYNAVNQTVTKNEVVKGVLGVGEFSLFVSKPGMGKSALLVDIGCHVAAGLPWQGHQVKQGMVVFFAAERRDLTERRVAAWQKTHGVADIPFVVVSGKMDMTSGLVDATALAATIKQLEAECGHACKLVIFDTLSRLFGGGDQHQSKDMGRFVQSVDEITRSTGAHAAVIHHSPWSDDRGKGAIDLDGAIDVSFVIKKTGKVFCFECTGANDGEEGVVSTFTLESVDLGTDADGNVTTAPVVVQAVRPASRGPTGHSAVALASLLAVLETHGEDVEGVTAVRRDDWRERYYEDTRVTSPNVEDNTVRKRFTRAVADLTDKNEVDIRDEWCWLA